MRNQVEIRSGSNRSLTERSQEMDDDKCARVRCGLPLTGEIVETPEGPRYHRECWEDMLDGIGAP